jgi:hypothetical protein
MRQQEARQGRLFEDNNSVRVLPLQKEVAQQATHELMQWMRVLERLQYALVDRARQLGWAEVDVVDEDLGCTASGIHRPGFLDRG